MAGTVWRGTSSEVVAGATPNLSGGAHRSMKTGSGGTFGWGDILAGSA
jgi:hypothetical protein